MNSSKGLKEMHPYLVLTAYGRNEEFLFHALKKGNETISSIVLLFDLASTSAIVSNLLFLHCNAWASLFIFSLYQLPFINILLHITTLLLGVFEHPL